MKSSKHIADRIRLMIATKQFQVGEILPSTRVLGKQLNTSFHTVRKAYQVLTDEGLLRAEPGRGFIVDRQNAPLDKSARLDMGAEKVRVLLEELIGYGLDEDEVETLFEEQLNFLEWPDRLETCASVGVTNELGNMLSRAIRRQIGVKSSVVTEKNLTNSLRFDALFVPIRLFRTLRGASESGLLLPIVYGFDASILISVVERSAVQSIGVVAFDDASIPVLTDELNHSLNFQGTILAAATGGKMMPSFSREVDLLLYTFETKALVEKSIPERNRLMLQYQVSETSCDVIRAELWDQ